jgi:hypothetical protein
VTGGSRPPVLVTGATGRRPDRGRSPRRVASSGARPDPPGGVRGDSSRRRRGDHRRLHGSFIAGTGARGCRDRVPRLDGGWRRCTRRSNASSRGLGSSGRSSARGCSRRTHCSGGRPRSKPTASSGGRTPRPKPRRCTTATSLRLRRSPSVGEGHAGADYVLTGPDALTQATRLPTSCDGRGSDQTALHRSSRLILRSARIRPDVWHVGQYVTSCDSYDTRRRSSPHTGQGDPYRPCTVK